MAEKKTPLNLENLEDRCVPTTWGNVWADGSALTLSFAPDGTDVGNQQSGLFEQMNAHSDPEHWQVEILSAFQTWAAQTNLNVSVVEDGGQAFGSPGDLQGDLRFGDFRIGSVSLKSHELAQAQGFDWSAGTWSGDVLFNLNYQFDANPSGSEIDLYSVALHEAGHSFGLGHLDHHKAVMHDHLHGTYEGLHGSDIKAIQELYGVRDEDSFEHRKGNDSFGRATSIDLYKPGEKNDKAVVADLTTMDDVDYYKFTFSSLEPNPGPVSVQLQTSGVSSLTAKLTVFNSKRKEVASATAINPMSGDLTLHLGELPTDQTYYIKVEKGADNVFGIGSYELRLQADSTIQVAEESHSPTTEESQPVDSGEHHTHSQEESLPVDSNETSSTTTTTDNHHQMLSLDANTNDTVAEATSLMGAKKGKQDTRYAVSYYGSLHNSSDIDIYKVSSPKKWGDVEPTMTVGIWGLDQGQKAPKLTILDEDSKPIDAEIVVSEGSNLTVQINGIPRNTKFYIQVEADEMSPESSVGNYFFHVNFGHTTTNRETAASGTLRQDNPGGGTDLTLHEDTLFNFALATRTSDSTVDAAVRLTIFNEHGEEVFTTVARAGETVTANVLLGKGSYRAQIFAATRTGEILPDIGFALKFLTQDGNIDPYTIDPTADSTNQYSLTLDPSNSSGSSSTVYEWSTTDYVWDLYYLMDPYSDSFWF